MTRRRAGSRTGRSFESSRGSGALSMFALRRRQNSPVDCPRPSRSTIGYRIGRGWPRCHWEATVQPRPARSRSFPSMVGAMTVKTAPRPAADAGVRWCRRLQRFDPPLLDQGQAGGGERCHLVQVRLGRHHTHPGRGRVGSPLPELAEQPTPSVLRTGVVDDSEVVHEALVISVLADDKPKI